MVGLNIIIGNVAIGQNIDDSVCVLKYIDICFKVYIYRAYTAGNNFIISFFNFRLRVFGRFRFYIIPLSKKWFIERERERERERE